jgi:hypothetical protein
MHLKLEDDGVRVVLVPGHPAHIIDGWNTIIDTDAVGTPLLLEYISLAFHAHARGIAIKIPAKELGANAWRVTYDLSADAMAVYLASRESITQRRVHGREIDTTLCFDEHGLLLSIHVKVQSDIAVRMQRHWLQ